jgi:hypothetical protein
MDMLLQVLDALREPLDSVAEPGNGFVDTVPLAGDEQKDCRDREIAEIPKDSG